MKYITVMFVVLVILLMISLTSIGHLANMIREQTLQIEELNKKIDNITL